MAREALGTKRVCPETGKKFYDLNKDPIVSPYTGKSYPVSFFEEAAPVKVKKEPKAAVVDDEAETEEELDDEDAPEFVSLEDADDDDTDDTVDDDDEELPEIPDVDIEVEDDDDDADDTFLEDEEEDDDLADVIGGGVEGDEEV
ncbi:MAG: TIGR02300 family protein [Nitratireductor sp.]